MLISMTGFGAGTSIENDSEVYIEVKSVNHRFLEISIKPNDLYNDLDKFIIRTGDEIWGLATLPKPNIDGIGILSEQIIHSGIYLFEDIENKLPQVKFNEVNFKASTNLAKYIVKNYGRVKQNN